MQLGSGRETYAELERELHRGVVSRMWPRSDAQWSEQKAAQPDGQLRVPICVPLRRCVYPFLQHISARYSSQSR